MNATLLDSDGILAKLNIDFTLIISVLTILAVVSCLGRPCHVLLTCLYVGFFSIQKNMDLGTVGAETMVQPPGLMIRSLVLKGMKLCIGSL